MRGPETDQKPRVSLSPEVFERHQTLLKDPDFKISQFLFRFRQVIDQRRREGENVGWIVDFITQSFPDDFTLRERLASKGYDLLDLDLAHKVSEGIVGVVVLKP